MMTGTVRRRAGAAAGLPLVIGAVLSLASCSAETGPFDPNPGRTATIAMTADAFRPAVDTVEVGSRVIWENQSERSHTVTADGGAFDSGAVGVGETFTRALLEPATISYRCNFHRGMTGTLVVVARSGGEH